ncbi:LacI family DNA-binding transcriptional regulator [Cellulomonas soli]|uniref:LacI family transcriptional regulator n=1 Tax=Cellulomonas soli TaxID=931535 RepID=A0A512P8C8_9CELL|nr:LacI family DNA-binding transcriptional regulator [Cellulomonas soli]NYI57680.1 LacI family transcriptional regulator [Cellulomonas soli]GEP67458.1 LacI family transcriptional regulator [Cellulomonas soli]
MVPAARPRRASITDVARAAHVSVGTVSNVLNRPDRVAPQTRARVTEAIAALSFVPNAPARQLRAGTVTTVGVVVLDIRNPFFTDMARGVEDRLAQDDFTLMLASSDDSPERERRFLRLFEEHGVAGVLVVTTGDDVSHLREVMDRGVDVVLLDSPSPDASIPSVAVDDVAGGEAAARHILQLGHRRIAVLNGSHGIRQCRDRFEGVLRAVRAAGLDPDEVVEEVPLATLDAAGGEAAITALLARDGAGLPSGLFCVNDLVAIGAQRGLRRAGHPLPGDLALVGYDDIDVAAELAVPLTSVRQPTHELGFRAADILLSRRTGTATGTDHVVFQPELVVRASSQPAR